jgi:hypothetical protein
VMRITDPAMIPNDPTYPALGLVHEYSRYPALNADGSKALLEVLGGADRGYFYLINVTTGERLAKIAPSRGDPSFSWHPTDPNRVFYRYDSEIRVFHADTQVVETVISMPGYGTITDQQEGRPSDDWRYYAAMGYRNLANGTCCDWNSVDILVLDLVQKVVIAKWTPASVPDWVGMSPKGQYVVAMFTNGDGTRLYNRTDLSYVRTLFPDYAHADFAIDANGDEQIVYIPQSAAQVTDYGNKTGLGAVRLRDGQKTLLLETGWWWSAWMSGIASRQRPGWVLISTANTAQPGPGYLFTQQPFGREVFWLALDGSGAVRRIAHHHSDYGYRNTNYPNEVDYFSEPHATSSWDGNTVMFSSVWGDSFTRYDVYAVTGRWWP